MFKFNITGDNLVLKIEGDRNNLNSGSKGYYVAEFTFDSAWEGLIPHITVEENGTPRADEVINDNRFEIATTESGIMQIGVYGLDSNGKKCISSNLVCIKVSPGAYTGVAPLPKDIWDGYQITVLGYVERSERAATSAKASADSAAKAAEDAAESAKASAESAKESAKSVQKISDMTVSAEDLPEGSHATVVKTEAADTLHLTFGIPDGKKGEQGPKGDKGDAGKNGKDGIDGKTPVKGEDYFTPEDIEGLNIPVVDNELDKTSDNAIANKIVAEFVEETKAPKSVIEFANGLKLESRDDGVYLIYKEPISETEEETKARLFFIREGVIYADESWYAEMANCDTEGNSILSTYATKKEVGYLEQNVENMDNLTHEHEERIRANAFDIGDLASRIDNLEESMGDINTALLEIITLQEELLTPDGNEVEY